MIFSVLFALEGATFVLLVVEPAPGWDHEWSNGSVRNISVGVHVSGFVPEPESFDGMGKFFNI